MKPEGRGYNIFAEMDTILRAGVAETHMNQKVVGIPVNRRNRLFRTWGELP